MIDFIDTGSLERVSLGQGLGKETEVVGPDRCGAKNVRGLLRWLETGEGIEARPMPDSHQLLYILEGEGVFHLEGKDYPADPGAGLYLGPGEGARLSQAGSAALKVFHLAVPPPQQDF
ncbi:MAG: cupin domain-containing protein [Nitrospinota bacterium]